MQQDFSCYFRHHLDTDRHVTLQDAEMSAIELEYCGAGLTIKGCTFSGNGSAAIYMYNSSPKIEDCEMNLNDGDTYGAAIYCYNGTPHLRDNYVHDNDYNGARAYGGGGPKMTTYYLGDPHANRFEDNNTYTHTPRADSTWTTL